MTVRTSYIYVVSHVQLNGRDIDVERIPQLVFTVKRELIEWLGTVAWEDLCWYDVTKMRDGAYPAEQPVTVKATDAAEWQPRRVRSDHP